MCLYLTPLCTLLLLILSFLYGLSFLSFGFTRHRVMDSIGSYVLYHVLDSIERVVETALF